MQVEVGNYYGEGVVSMMAEEEQGWETPRREECRIPVVLPCPPPPRKKAAALPERREPPKGGYFQEPPDIESFFVLKTAPRRRQATTCG